MVMQVTLDGMVRALRLRVHGLAEDREEEDRRAMTRNERVLSLLTAESQRFRLEAGDEFGG